MALDLETAKYVAEKSKDMVDRQIAGHRQKQANSSTIIGVNALFIPFFLNGLNDAHQITQWLSIIPITGIGTAIFILMRGYFLKPLYQGLSLQGYDNAIKKKFDDAILYEIGVNKYAYEQNDKILALKNIWYDRAVFLTLSCLGFSILLLTVNMLIKQEPQKIKIDITKSEIEFTVNHDSIYIEQIKKITLPINKSN